jgi:predicted nucleotidyltransferase
MGKILTQRRDQTEVRLRNLRAELEDAEALCKDKACAYATGSFGRGEAGKFSDLDLFIVGLNGHEPRALTQLDEIQVKADLIRVTAKHEIPEFSGDGEYLAYYPVKTLTKFLGGREDDATNTFTARLLLLLESQPLLGAGVYHSVVDEVLASYWRDYVEHSEHFMPSFLANDILRLWRTLCVNYEAYTANDPEEKRAKRRLKNYKLKHSRMLTCFSALLYLMGVLSRHRTVSPEHAKEMVTLSPTARLEWLAEELPDEPIRDHVARILRIYEKFLESTESDPKQQVKQFFDNADRKPFQQSQNQFGDCIYDLLALLGTQTEETKRFLRMLIV